MTQSCTTCRSGDLRWESSDIYIGRLNKYTYDSTTPVGVAETVDVVTDDFPEEEDAAAEEEEAASHGVQLVDDIEYPLSGQGLWLGRFVEEGGGQKVHHPRHLAALLSNRLTQ